VLKRSLTTGVLLALALTTGSSVIVAQVPSGLPSGAAAQAQQLLGHGGGNLSQQLRERLMQSGMTPDQIRSRLEEAGYPDSLLDNYLGGAEGGGGLDTLAPSPEVLNAVAQLGIIDSLGVDSLIGTQRVDSLLAKRQSGMFGDTTDTSYTRYGDSLLLGRALRRMRPPGDAYAFDSLADTAAQSFVNDSLRVIRNRIRSVLADTSLSFDRKQRLLRLLAPPDTTLGVFGMNLFRKGRTQFQPLAMGPVDPSYKIEPGDRLVLILTGQVELARNLTVTREGFTVVPQVGEINVANLTLTQLDDVLYDRLGRVYSGVRRGPTATTHFSVSIARLHTSQVYVVGDVMQPGAYQISGAGTALSAIYAAGGPSPNGSLRHILVRRGGVLVDSLDAYDYLLRGDASHDVRLETGDVVFVSVHGPRVAIAGEIIRPDYYEMRPGETLADALQDAGGFEPTASHHRVQITRILPPDQRGGQGNRERVVIDVTAPDIEANAGTSITLSAGDSIHVFKVDIALRNGINVAGDVWNPGNIGFQPGLRLSDALKLAGGLRPDAYLGTVLIARARPDSTRSQLRTSLRSTDGTPTDDIVLEAHDDIRIFALHDMRPNRYVAIAGAVRHGGRFAYHDGMTIRDLVLLAGGPTEGASLKEAEIARLPENRAGGVTAVTMRVPIDSTYLPERMADSTLPKPIDPPDVVLLPYDNVLILREADWTLPRTVVVSGEVKSPGRYTLTNKSERLRDVIERAGGLTRAADPDGLDLVRKADRVGRVGVNIQNALEHPKSRDNVIMEDRDSIYVPPYTGVVRVAGAVNAPVTVSYVPGKDIYYYVTAAGGPGTRADLSRAYVKQPDGTVQGVRHHGILPASVPNPRPGAEVVVPDKEIRIEQPDQTLQYVATAVQLITGLATVIYLTRH
jgi:polysaccharide biosynthesis/export protein